MPPPGRASSISWMPNGSTGRRDPVPPAPSIIRRSSANGIEDGLAAIAITLLLYRLEQIVNTLESPGVNENWMAIDSRAVFSGEEDTEASGTGDPLPPC